MISRQNHESAETPGRDRPLRVVLVNTADRGRGAETSIMALHAGLQRLGHESQLYVGTKAA